MINNCVVKINVRKTKIKHDKEQKKLSFSENKKCLHIQVKF